MTACRDLRERADGRANVPAAPATRDALTEDVEWLLGGGEVAERIARRVGYTHLSPLVRQLQRIGRQDLARALKHRAGRT